MIDVVIQCWCAIINIPWYSDRRRSHISRLRSIDVNLCASSVKLWGDLVVGDILQGQDFGSNEVISTGEITGDCSVDLSIVGDHFVGSPLVVVISVPCYLEPAVSRCRG